MPGLYTQLQTTLPNDESRLNAEGVIKGLESELLNLVTQRALYEQRIRNALDNNKIELAEEFFKLYEELPTVDRVRVRISNDETRLKSQTADKREREFITLMFKGLRTMVSTSVSESKSPALKREILAATENQPRSKKKR